MKLFTRCLVLVLTVSFFPLCANAQVVGVARGGRTDKPRIHEGGSPNSKSEIVGVASPTDNLGKKQYNVAINTSQNKEDLNRNLRQALLNRNRQPAYFGDGYVYKMCQQVNGCIQWAQAENGKSKPGDTSFVISLFRVEHDCAVVVNGKKVIKHQYAKFTYTRNGAPQLTKTFALVNVPVNSKQCIQCGNVSTDCQTFLVGR